MKPRLAHRTLWLALTVALVLSLGYLDRYRGGPASLLSRCNLLLARSAHRAADVVIVGSSRSGAALDPTAMQEMLAYTFVHAPPKVERIALGHNPLRVSHALLESYIETRGAPRVVVLELMFMTERSVDRLEARGLGLPPEQYIFRRDLNLMTFAQIVSMPSVAMPFSEGEGLLDRWRFRLRGAILRAGALLYEFLSHPIGAWDLSACDRNAWTREPEWPDDFAFAYGNFKPTATPEETAKSLRGVMATLASERRLAAWQVREPEGRRYPYDFAAPYRQGEVAMLESMLELASRHQISVVLLPLPLYGYSIDSDDLSSLAEMLPERAHVFDLYGSMGSELALFWYDDGHIEAYPAGALATATLAQHLLDGGLLPRSRDALLR